MEFVLYAILAPGGSDILSNDLVVSTVLLIALSGLIFMIVMGRNR